MNGQPANEFQNPNNSGTILAQIPWGTIGASQSFYKQEENTLAIGLRVGTQDPQPQLTVPTNRLNTLGATVTDKTLADIIAGPTDIACMTPFLSVSETIPVDSAIEIFYESSTSGNIVDLYKQL